MNEVESIYEVAEQEQTRPEVYLLAQEFKRLCCTFSAFNDTEKHAFLKTADRLGGGVVMAELSNALFEYCD